ncbi:MAG: DNA polymerase III subunit gamma/tau [Parcubacteria group bacterium]
MSIALYRKYRPKTFSEVTDQNHIKITLQNEIETGKIAHAYLFCGPRGTGKTTLARLVAKAANCLDIQPGGEPCNKCASCLDILSNRALDVIEIDAASNTGIDNVRENIIGSVRFTPAKSKFKVFIIDEVHMLSIFAFNALLKTLEEPPKHVIFILATTEAHKVPATIISRCQRFDFKKIIVSKLAERLKWIAGQEGVSVDDKVLLHIAKQAGGCVRDAESLLEQVFSLGEKSISLEQAELIIPKSDYDALFKFFKALARKATGNAIDIIAKMAADGLDIAQFTDDFVEFVRKILIYKISGRLEELARETDETAVKAIIGILPEVPEKQLTDMISKCLGAKELFRQSHIPTLPLEMAVFELTESCGLATAPDKMNCPEPALEKTEEKKIKFADKPEPAEMKAVAAEKAEIKSETAQAEPAEPETSLLKAEMMKDELTLEKNESLCYAGIVEKWPSLLNKVRERNMPLYMSLRMSKPVGFGNGKLSLGFLFDLQKQRVDNLSCRAALREILREVYSSEMEVETTIDHGLTLADLPNGSGQAVRRDISLDESVNELANEFEGEIVD